MKKILFLLLVGAILLTGCSNVESANGKAQNFSLQDTNNRTVRLSDYEGYVIILNFFATSCPPCRSEIPDFVELVDEYGGKDFAIIGISVGRNDAQALRGFANEFGINYPVLLDDGLVSKTYGPIYNIPTTFIIDKNKHIVEKIIGSRSKDYFENAIKPLL